MNGVLDRLLAARKSLEHARQELAQATNLLVNTGQTTRLITPVHDSQLLADGLHDRIEQVVLDHLAELVEVEA